MKNPKIKAITKEAHNNIFTEEAGRKVFLAISLMLLCFIAFKGFLVSSWGPGPNYINYSVRTTVNVTNAYPEILNASCTDGTGITLTAGATKAVSCLIQARDYNGGDTINMANATFHYYLNSSDDDDDGNAHYTNSSCLLTNADGYYANWTCVFNVWYYANNGTWQVNATVNDSYSKTDNYVGNATILPLLALNVTNLIDFGQLAVTETSASAVSANVTNFGNRQINVTVYGFGGDDIGTGAGIAMMCDQRNLTLDNERYDVSAATTYDDMTLITGSPVTVDGLTLAQQTDDAQPVVSSTYWRLHVNVSTNPFGICNGTVVFAAISPP
jgi:hypothetical protein